MERIRGGESEVRLSSRALDEERRKRSADDGTGDEDRRGGVTEVVSSVSENIRVWKTHFPVTVS